MEIELIEPEPQAAPPSRALTTPTPADLLQTAIERDLDIEKLQALVVLQNQWEARQAKKAFDQAFAAFKDEAVQVVKNTVVSDGPLKGKSYVNLSGVVAAVTPALSRHGLVASWKLTKDTPPGEGGPGWMEVTCTLRHVAGHEEAVFMGGAPDVGPGRNALQARASTKSYLERYTLLAITGMAASDSDDDGNGAGAALLDVWVGMVKAADTTEKVVKIGKDGAAAFTKAKDVDGYRQFAAEVARRKNELKEAGK